MNDRSLPVSSIMSTTAEIGPCVVAASTAPAPRTADSPGGIPDQRCEAACPSIPPSKAHSVSEGVNKPPGAPLRRQSTVAAGLRRSSSSNNAEEVTPPENSNSERSRPLPRSCGKPTEIKPSRPRAKTGATNRCHPAGVVRSAQATALTYPTATTPAMGPIRSAQARVPAE